MAKRNDLSARTTFLILLVSFFVALECYAQDNLVTSIDHLGIPDAFDNLGDGVIWGQTFIAKDRYLAGIRLHLGDKNMPPEKGPLEGPAWLVLYDAGNLSDPVLKMRELILDSGETKEGLGNLLFTSPQLLSVGKKYYVAVETSDLFGAGLRDLFMSTYGDGAEAQIINGEIVEATGLRDLSFLIWTIGPGSYRAFLSSPISGDIGVDTDIVSALLDHHIPTGYNCNSTGCGDPETGAFQVLAFDGTLADSDFGSNCDPPGYRIDCGGSVVEFPGIVSYVGSCSGNVGSCSGGGTGSASYLNYDGHSGVDFPYPGNPIYAAASGILEIVEEDPINCSSGSANSGFNALRVLHGNGLETWYLHAREGSECFPFFGCDCSEDSCMFDRPTVGAQVAVGRGERIGTVGNTGVLGCDVPSPPPGVGEHLHFEVRVTDNGQVIDPFSCSAGVASDWPLACLDSSLWLDLVFEDGFEGGDTSGWSATVP